MSKRTCDTSNSTDAKRARTEGAIPMFYDLDPTEWQFNPNPDNTMFYISYKNDKNRPVRFQLPRMRTPFGAAPGYAPKGGPPPPADRRNVELDVADNELVKWGAVVDDAMVKYLCENNVVKKSKGDEAFVRAIFRGLIPEGKDDFNPLLRTKAMKEGRHAAHIRVVSDPGSDTTDMTYYDGVLEDIESNDDVLAVVEVTGLWYINNSVGISVRLTDAMVYKKSNVSETVFNLPGVAGVTKVDRDAPTLLPEPTVDCASDEGEVTEHDALPVNTSDPFA